jgi:hypothetical protein
MDQAEAAKHLFEVATGFAADAPGDDRILLQNGEALSLSLSSHCLGLYLGKLFNEALRLTNKARRLWGYDETPSFWRYCDISKAQVLVDQSLGDWGNAMGHPQSRHYVQ